MKSYLSSILLYIPVTLKLFSTISGETECHGTRILSHTVGNSRHLSILLGVSSRFMLVIHWLQAAGKQPSMAD
jgi:hypothetical protein